MSGRMASEPPDRVRAYGVLQNEVGHATVSKGRRCKVDLEALEARWCVFNKCQHHVGINVFVEQMSFGSRWSDGLKMVLNALIIRSNLHQHETMRLTAELLQPPDSRHDWIGLSSKNFWDILQKELLVQWMDCSLCCTPVKRSRTLVLGTRPFSKIIQVTCQCQC